MSNVHPTMAKALLPLMPAAAEAIATAASQQVQRKLRPFTVRIGTKGNPRLEFAAMAHSAGECFDQHVDLAEVGERVEVLPAVTKDERALAEKFGGKPFDLLPTLDALPPEFDRRKP